MNTPKSRDNELVVQELGKEVLIYDLDNHKAYCLNETSAIIWKLCDGKTSVGQMSLLLAEQLNEPISEEIIWLALDDFKKKKLLADNEKINIEFNGLTRRQVIRKVGLASMVALPVISSLVAPTALNAASGGSAATAACLACSANTDCASGRCRNVTGTPAPYPRACSDGTDVNTTRLPGNSFTTTNAQSPGGDCTSLIARFCCNATGTFTTNPGNPNVQTCTCT